jgi:hypothetical protein
VTVLHDRRQSTADIQRAPVGAKRRNPMHMLLGAGCVLVCALIFAVADLRLDPRSAVLALVGPVQAGHVLTEADLSIMHIVPDANLSTLDASQRPAVVGRTARLPLAAHSLLSGSVLGPAGWPPAGQSLIAVPVKAGHAPQGVVTGARVLVMVVPTDSVTTGQAPGLVQQAQAAVYAVEPADSAGTTVVSLLLNSADAERIVGASGDVALLVQAGTR